MTSKMMSSMLEKTVEQTMSFIRGTTSQSTMSDFRVKNLQEAIVGTNRTMQMREYQQTIEKCTKLVARKSQEMNLTWPEKRECLLAITHLSNLNQKLPLVHPFVIKCIEDSRSLLDKRLGYIALTLLSKSRGSDVYLAVNTILKDISSRSSAVSCIALTTLTSVVDVDLIPVFLPSVLKLLKSGDSATRCKVFSVLHTMVRVGQEYLVSIWDVLARALCDRDPHVMSASLPIISTMVQKVPPQTDLKLHEKVIFILKQVEQGCLPIDMMHGGISGPWIQIRLLIIIRKLPEKHFADSDFDNLTGIFTKIFARFQQTTHLHVAIIFESVLTIIAFHPKLDHLERKLIDVLDKTLSSPNPNVLHCGVDMIKTIATLKPGFSKRYAETLLNTLSDRNPITLKLTLQLIDDFTSSEDSEKIVEILVEKLKNMSNFEFKKEIFISLLKILEKFPVKDGWILENYFALLGYMKNDLDFGIVKRLLKYMQSVPKEAMQEEAIEIAKALKHKFTALQYCATLEIITFCNKGLPDEVCQKAACDILDNCRRIIWQTNHEEILALSWCTVVSLVTQHNVEVDISKFERSSNNNPSIILLQHRGEMVHLVENCNVSKVFTDFNSSSLMKLDIDPNLTFLDDFTKANDDLEVTRTDQPENHHNGNISTTEPPTTKESSAFKTQPYTKSRFNMSDTPLQDDIKPKKKFLEGPSRTEGVVSRTTVWDRKNYNLDVEAREPNDHVD